MTRLAATCFAHPQRGGVTLLTVLGLLGLATLLAFSLTKSALREASTSGTVWQANRASEAAEAGLDWCLVWADKNNAAQAIGNQRDVLQTTLSGLMLPNVWQNTQRGWDVNNTWDRAFKVSYDKNTGKKFGSTASAAANDCSDMLLTNSGTTFMQGGSPTPQSFDVAMRYLGHPMIKTISSNNMQTNLFQVVSTGKAQVTSDTAYEAQREMHVTLMP